MNKAAEGEGEVMEEQTADKAGSRSLVSRFSDEDKQALQNAKNFFTTQMGQVAQVAGSAESSMAYAAQVAGSMASIANSAATIRQSDNNVFIMSQAIAAKKEMFHDFLTTTFAGRDKAIDTLIDQIANGVNQNDTEILLKAMDGLTKIVSSSPWPDFDALNKMIDSGAEIVLD